MLGSAVPDSEGSLCLYQEILANELPLWPACGGLAVPAYGLQFSDLTIETRGGDGGGIV